jgi:hypothetical protein
VDVLAHGLWAGAGVLLARRRWEVSSRTAALVVALAVAPDLPQLVPILGWLATGSEPGTTVENYVMAQPGHEPPLPELVQVLTHHLHCMTHSAIVAGAITLLLWVWTRSLWIPLLGWWSHIVIDVFTHSADYYPSPVFYPITREGFDGVAWNAPWFMALNYAALAVVYVWLLRTGRTPGRGVGG